MIQPKVVSRTCAEEASQRRQGALLLNWFDIAQGWQEAFDDWHNREHVIERMGVPGFMQGRRFEALGTPRIAGHSYLVAYDAADIGVFKSPAYAARLDNPTPLTARVVPHLRNLTRTVYEVEARRGGGTAGYLRTIRLASTEGSPADAALLRDTVEALYSVSGVSGVILGRPDATVTHYKDTTREGQATETLVRDAYPWIVIVEACRAAALDEASGILGEAVAALMPGTAPLSDSYQLVFSMTTEQGSP